MSMFPTLDSHDHGIDLKERDKRVQERITLLNEMGFRAGFGFDIRVGDVIAKEPEAYMYHDWGLMAVDRILRSDGSFYEEDGEFVPNTVLSITGYDEDDRHVHQNYGSSHGFYIWRQA